MPLFRITETVVYEVDAANEDEAYHNWHEDVECYFVEVSDLHIEEGK